MTQDEIIKLAREAGLLDKSIWSEYLQNIERFAALVREEVYKQDDMTTAYMVGFEKGKDAGILLEREACAQICEKHAKKWRSNMTQDCANAIRLRGAK